jgi:ATP-dependent RNA helicase RhlE
VIFKELNLIEPLLEALAKQGYDSPTPIQQQAIPVILNQKDLLACAQTGTGKTAAFTLPLLQMLHQKASNFYQLKALILTPTRELAIQIGESISTYGQFLRLKHTVVYGGVSQKNQVQAIRKGLDILVATPGRLLDLLQQGVLSLKSIEYFVIDEADRMLDMGFLHDVRKIIQNLPNSKQSLFFSATYPPEIIRLADSLLYEPLRVEIEPVKATTDLIQQSVYFVENPYKLPLLKILIKDPTIDSLLLFTQRKHTADKISKSLQQAGIKTEALHSNKSQNARQAALQKFKSKKIQVLVATDIAARGLDIDQISHVLNFDLPPVAEVYVHRIGRTGRAGASGIAISFCDQSEKTYLHAIQKWIHKTIDVVKGHAFDGYGGGFKADIPVPTTSARSAPKGKRYRALALK